MTDAEPEYDNFVVEPITNNLACRFSCLTSCDFINHLYPVPGPPCWAGQRLQYVDPSHTTCDIGGGSQQIEPAFAQQQLTNPEGGTETTVQCLYLKRRIDTISQSRKADEKFGPMNGITRAFCGSKTTTCPAPMKGCSRYFSIADDGPYCRDIFNNMTDAQKDSVMREYCLRNNTDDCKCVNRTLNADYIKLKQGNPFSDACWYIPCTNRARFFVPSDFSGEQVSCPTNICQIVYDISQAHDVDIESNKNDINCDFGGGHYEPTVSNLWIFSVGLALSLLLLFVYASKK